MKLSDCDYAEAVLQRERRECRGRWVEKRRQRRYSIWCLDAYYRDQPGSSELVSNKVEELRAEMRREAAARLSIAALTNKSRGKQFDSSALLGRQPLPAESGGVGGASVLDACCGSRMFWFDRADARAVFVDKRRETHELPDVSSTGGSRTLIIDPDIQADFTALPFEDGCFALVVFDPPHLVRNGKKGWLAKKYGKLEGDWREELRDGFAECFRVLKPEGALIFKWNEHEVPVSQVLSLTPERPLIGNKCGKAAKSHWIVFLKGGGGGFCSPSPAQRRPNEKLCARRKETLEN